MPPFRLIHAAGFDPDAYLPKLPPRLAPFAETAARRAVERLVGCTIEQQADLLLITPAPPAHGLPSGPSLSAEAFLAGQLDRLTDEGITVCLAVESRESGWERLESSARVLFPGTTMPVANRSGQSVAILRCLNQPTTTGIASSVAPQEVLELAVAPQLSAANLQGTSSVRHDYLGLGCGRRETLELTSGFAHAPGYLQAGDWHDEGQHGATLVTFETGGPRLEFLPTAALRFEGVKVQAESDDSLDDLALKMAEQFEQKHALPGEAAWLVRWTVEAAGELFERLSHQSGRSEILGLLPETIGEALVVHQLQVVPHPLWPALSDPLAAEYTAVLQEQSNRLGQSEQRMSFLNLPSTAAHQERLRELMVAVDGEAALAGARRFGLHVTNAAADESSNFLT